jgi:putative transposase
MTPPAAPERYRHHRCPGAIISHGVWLSSRFPLSYRDGEEMLVARGIEVTHEALRQWGRQWGQDYAPQLKHRRAPPGDTWHLDEVFLTIHGERYDLWRAVDQDDNVLDMRVQRRHNKQAAKQCCRKLRNGLTYVPQVISTETLQSYGAAHRESRPGVDQRQSRSLNHHGAHSHRPTRHRAYRRQGFTSPGHAHRVLSAYGPMAQPCRPRRHRLSASEDREEMGKRCASWAAMTGTERAAYRGKRPGERHPFA